MQNKAQKQIYNWAELQFAGFKNHCNAALRKGELPGGSFDGVDREGTHQTDHVIVDIYFQTWLQCKANYRS